MFGSDVFLLARIANGGPEGSLAGYDLSRITPALLPLAERLIVAGHLERRAIWDEFLARGFERTPTLQATPRPEPAADAAIEPIKPPPPPDPASPAPLTHHREPVGSERGVRMTRALDLSSPGLNRVR